MSRFESRARGDGTDERAGHGAVRAHAEGSAAGYGAAREEWSCAWAEWAEGHHDVRAADERAARRSLPRALRWHVDRVERHDAADSWPGSGLGDRREVVR